MSFSPCTPLLFALLYPITIVCLVFIICSIARSIMPSSPILSLLPLLILAVAVHSAPPGTNHDYNRFLVANQHDVALSTSSPAPHNFTYTSTFPHTIQQAQDVYYTTQSLDANVMSNIVGTTASLRYELSLDFVNQTMIRTQINGYFDLQYFGMFTFRYLLVLPSTPWLSDYMVIEQFAFAADNTSLSTPLPTRFVPNNSISTAVMITDIWLQFDITSLAPNGHSLSLLWSESRTNSTYSLLFTCSHYLVNLQVRFLVIVIDTTALKSDYLEYKFIARNWWTNITSSSLWIPYSHSYQFQNYVFGLSKVAFKIYSDPSFSFSLAKSNSNSYMNLNYFGSNTSGLSYVYNYVIFPFMTCSNPSYPYLNQTDGLCYSRCPRLQYVGAARLCSSCRFDCLTCYNDSHCSSCNLTNRYLEPSNFSCLPKEGYYESNDPTPFNCTPPCRTCLNNHTFCTSCLTNTSTFFANNTCLLCSYLLEGCDTCNSTYCFTCVSPYRLASALYCNLPCSDSNCAVCSNANTSFCYTCNTRYFRANPSGICVATCGDGLVQNTEQCDDGNEVQHDGCHYCTQEPYYQCHNTINSNGLNETLYCAYTKPIEFSVVSTEKLEYQNRISITITVSQYMQSFWKTRSALSYCFVQSPIPYRNMQVSFMQSHQGSTAKLASPLVMGYPSASLMQISFEYLRPIHGQTINLSLNFKSATDVALVQIPSYNISLAVLPENNLAAHLYTEQTYRNQGKLSGFFMFISIGGLGLLLLSYFIGGKRIIVQMLVVFQVTFISLASAPLVTPLLSAVTTLSVCNNGYNIFANTTLRAVEDTLSDGRAKGMHLYSQFLYNVNTGLLMVVVPLLVGIVVALVAKVGDHSEQKLKRMQKVYRLALGEWTFIGLIFCGCIVGGSAVFQIRFGMNEISSLIGLLSLIIAGVVLLFYPLYLWIRGKFPQCFGQYKEILIDGDSAGLAFQMVYLLLGLLLGATLCAFGQFRLINCIVGGIPLIMFAITLFRPLFKKQFDHYRTQLNLMSLTLVQLPFLHANLGQSLEYSSESDLNVAIPLFLGLILFLNLIGNVCFFVYTAVKRVRSAAMERGKLMKANGKDEESVHSKQLQEILKSSLINPLSHLQQQPKEVEGFIEYSDIDPQEAALKQIIRKNCQKVIETNPDNSVKKAMVVDKDYIQAKFDEIDEL